LSPPAGFILPAQPTLVPKPPAGPDWVHEVKHDGYRLLVRKQAGRVTLWSRYGTDFTRKLPRIAEAVRSLPADDVVIDGEARGAPPGWPQRLRGASDQSRRGRHPAVQPIALPIHARTARS